MSVISDRGPTTESPDRTIAPSGQTHEQRAAWAVPGLPWAILVWVAFAVGVGLLFDGDGAVVGGIVLLVIFAYLLVARIVRGVRRRTRRRSSR